MQLPAIRCGWTKYQRKKGDNCSSDHCETHYVWLQQRIDVRLGRHRGLYFLLSTMIESLNLYIYSS